MKTLFYLNILIITLLFPCSDLCAQEMMTPMREMFCQPGIESKSPGKGVSIEYGLFPSYKIHSTAEKNSHLNANDHLLIKLKAPIVNKPRFKFLVGIRHFREAYDFGKIATTDQWLFQNLENKTLKNTRISAYLSHAFNSKNYLGFKTEIAYTGDYNGLINLDQRYRHIYAVGVFGVKPHANKEWGVGLVSRFGYQGNAVIPFLIYNQTFNSKWGIEATLPVKLMVRYNVSEKDIILFGPEFGSRHYSVDFLENPSNGPIGSYNIRSREFQTNIAYNHQLSRWLWMEFKTGYVHYLESEYEGIMNQEAVDFEIDPSNGLFFKFGLFLYPPKDYFK